MTAEQEIIADCTPMTAEDIKKAKLLEVTWGYDRKTVNGVVYDTVAEADRVRSALIAAGIAHYYPGCREARAVLKAAGIN